MLQQIASVLGVTPATLLTALSLLLVVVLAHVVQAYAPRGSWPYVLADKALALGPNAFQLLNWHPNPPVPFAGSPAAPPAPPDLKSLAPPKGFALFDFVILLVAAFALWLSFTHGDRAWFVVFVVLGLLNVVHIFVVKPRLEKDLAELRTRQERGSGELRTLCALAICGAIGFGCATLSAWWHDSVDCAKQDQAQLLGLVPPVVADLATESYAGALDELAQGVDDVVLCTVAAVSAPDAGAPLELQQKAAAYVQAKGKRLANVPAVSVR